MANPAEKIFDHSWLDPECIEAGCKSLILKHECRTRAESQVDLADLLAAEKRKVSLLRDALNVTMPRYTVTMPCLVMATIEVEARNAEQATQFASDRIQPEHVTVIQATEPNRAHADRCCMSSSQLAQACKEIAAGKR